jgi:hypothetical protein
MVGPEKSMWSFVDSTYSVVAPGNAENSFILVARSPARNGGVHLAGSRIFKSSLLDPRSHSRRFRDQSSTLDYASET